MIWVALTHPTVDSKCSASFIMNFMLPVPEASLPAVEFGVGHLADEDVAGGIDTVFGIGVEPGNS
ncbi:MAG: hypothetical protein FD187_2769 [bacterium]|nr:MAG: hypothetical protein FD142_1203 [bacterium]KAF0147468.1 MAG: hypothetical protein FD187_2769 [bacterium]KAF0166325.1 MAG: hypothetical protein FD158_2697 [bacterium]TXT18228.1 MAG: hypothetical protein FD132_2141 [bacterium]